MSISPEPETVRLRTALRDLVALSTITAAWVGREPATIAAGLVDVVVESLGLDFAFVRLRDPNGADAVEMARGDAWKSFPEWLRNHHSVLGQLSPRKVIPNVDGCARPCRGIVIPLGVEAEGGLVAAASGRASFPDEIDALLLSVAGNQGATAFQSARLLEELRRTEAALRRAHDELETRVAERTAELRRTVAELQERRTELAHVTRVTTMGELTASIAHELRQPIAASLTSAQTALRWLDAQPPELAKLREAVSRIVRAGKRAGDVIDRIRALATNAPPQMVPVEINAAISEVIELMQEEAVKKGALMRMELTPGLPLVQGDRVQLQQVILNLIMNGIEAMSSIAEGSRDLQVSTSKDDETGVLVAVRDTGPGLQADAFEQAFAAFYTTKPAGLGLGLSICRSIIEAHGGRLWASANEPHGAALQFTLPVEYANQ